MIDDVKLAVRGIARYPAFSAIVVLTLAVAIGLNTAIFSIVDRVVLRPLPYPDAERLVHFRAVREQSGQTTYSVAYADFEEFGGAASAFASLGGYRTGRWVLSGPDRTPRRLDVAEVTNDFFDVLGVRPELGRTFVEDEHEDGNREVVILSHALWTTEFGADPSVLGRTVELGQRPFEVIGVMPPGFDYPYLRSMGGWLPLSNRAVNEGDVGEAFTARDWISLNVIGRLADEAPRDRAQEEVETISVRLAEAYPETNADLTHHIEPLQELETGSVRTPMLLTLSAVALILLIACANVASLLLARGMSRRTEVAMRAALGAGRGRLIRLFLTESVVYAALGGIAGVTLGEALLRLFPIVGFDAPLLEYVAIDVRVLVVVATITLGTGVVFGILPALSSSRGGPAGTLRGSGARVRTGGLTAHRTLIAAELAMTTVLAVGAGLLTNSLVRTLAEDPGFDPAGVLTVRVSLPPRYMQDPEDNWSGSNAFFDELVADVGSLRGVAAVGISYTNPLEPRTAFNTPIEIPGWLERPRPERPRVNIRPADPGFFDVFDLSAIDGRVVSPDDDKESEGVAVINRAMADLVFGDEDPIGYEVTGPNFWGAAGYPYPWRIVGVVPDVKSAGLTRDPAPAVYLPFTQAPMGNMRLLVRTDGDPETMAPAVRQAIWAIDPAIPADGLTTMEDEIRASVSSSRLAALSVGLFALVAIFLAAIGVYGVLAWSVGRRTAELGIRQALGAGQDEILRLVVGQGLRVALSGIGIGLVVAAFGARVLERFLYGVGSIDPLTYALVALGLLGVAATACLVPARRATAVDPSAALRSE